MNAQPTSSTSIDMRILYNIGIWFYLFFIHVAALFHPKAKHWVAGRKNWISQLTKWRENHPGKLVWIHCSSLGEFEQGRPVIESLKKEQLNVQILLTFFSPSGYEIRKDYKQADGVFYLPADTLSNAAKFVDISRPSLVIFVKYEFWANYLFTLKSKEIPIISISTIFREDQRFFKSKSGFWVNVLKCFDHFFVQNSKSAELLRQLSINSFTIVGDTRFDRVVEIANQTWSDPILDSFCKGRQILVIGSSYSTEEIIAKEVQSNIPELALIIAPHEVNENRVQEMLSYFGEEAMLWSENNSESEQTKNVLIIDSIGKLSMIYRYADVVLIGGGYGKGIHNTLEAAVYGKALFFGPTWQKFDEARGLIECGGALSVESPPDLVQSMCQILNEPEMMHQMGSNSKRFVSENLGATEQIMMYLSAKLK
jgi:3-deoxy-D-manno-octulosonic-acid transferase